LYWLGALDSNTCNQYWPVGKLDTLDLEKQKIIIMSLEKSLTNLRA
jgi:hypothetical protein